MPLVAEGSTSRYSYCYPSEKYTAIQTVKCESETHSGDELESLTQPPERSHAPAERWISKTEYLRCAGEKVQSRAWTTTNIVIRSITTWFITTITLLARMLTISALRAREGPSSGPSHRFWEDKASSSHLDDMVKAMAAIFSSNLHDAIECTNLRCVDDLDGPMHNGEEYSLFQIRLPLIHTLSSTKGCAYRKPLAGVHFSSMVLYRNSNADQEKETPFKGRHPASLTTRCTDVADNRGQEGSSDTWRMSAEFKLARQYRSAGT
ncbi:uncharacterized protein LACBIDRAFT_328442 [Laccaria bicolor S238N-H82]|uniref:Predicted protein n=1 Tax=Laccaria bicolor (strain S238N-H82 / ATCC MYA-4686) TaxID=486041 RepID=B0DEU4_LACBS|nr:uncharacterized protein LACBIDRAFT_328442 [Laccaria bicolor S238N-H82]EDR06729.1 predicted protein [Laccaria bicolor S238N-H82]|eukprot:XP_001882576.1 predicted protein [Laccaria bicolor S238N-H82]